MQMVTFLFCLLAVLGLYLVGVGVTLSRRRRHTCFAYVSIPTTTRYGRGEHCSPAKKHKDTFSLWYFCVTKSTKSHLRGLSSLLKNTFRVHEFVARAMRGKCVRHWVKRKSAVLPLSEISAIPRVRTQRTKKPSRFVHALSARPLKVHGGRGFGLFVDGIEVISAILSIGYTGVISCRGRRLDDPLLSRGEYCSPAKKHKVTFSFIALLHDQEEGSGWRSHL